jgi:hypothetical protein
LASVCIVALTVGMYLNRRKLRAWYWLRLHLNEEIIPVYSDFEPSDKCVRLENIRERSTSSSA